MKRYIISALIVLSSLAVLSSCEKEVVDNADIKLTNVYSVTMGSLVSNSLATAPSMPITLNVYYNDNKVVERNSGDQYKAFDVVELNDETADSIYKFSYKIEEEIKVTDDSTTMSIRTYDYHFIDSTSVYEAHINYFDAVADTVTQSLVYNVTIVDGEKYL